MKILKGAITGMVSVGVSQVVTNIVESTKPDNLSTIKKVTTSIGGYAIGAVISGLSSEYIDRQLDSLGEIYNTVKKGVEEDER